MDNKKFVMLTIIVMVVGYLIDSFMGLFIGGCISVFMGLVLGGLHRNN
jgi:hypothetical protein